MEVLNSRCCGLDVHEAVVVACLLTPGNGDKPRREVRKFGTFSRDLEALADWLGENGCTIAAMESTGSYWKPIYNHLEGRFAVIVVNAHHLKTVPGRKSDMKDAEWIATLLRHGLLRPSFVPQRERRELRELTRYRAKLVAERAAEANRIQKVLQEANIKLAQVASNVLGVSGTEMLEAMAQGESDPEVLASLARGRLASKHEELVAALTGSVGDHLRFLLTEMLSHIRDLEERVVRLDLEVANRMDGGDGSDAEARDRLDTIPGVGRTVAETIVAEVGTNMEQFGSASKLSSWAAICPGTKESAGKNRSGRTPRGNQSLKTALVQAAHATRATDTFLGALYRRLKRRIGTGRAAIAVGHRILVAAYHMLANNVPYRELGAHYRDQRQLLRATSFHTKALTNLGYSVTLDAAP